MANLGVRDLRKRGGYILACVLEMTFDGVRRFPNSMRSLASDGSIAKCGTEMGLGLVGLSGEEEQDAEVSLRVQVLGISRNYRGEFRDGQIGTFIMQVLIRLLLMDPNLLGDGESADACCNIRSKPICRAGRQARTRAAPAYLCAYNCDKSQAQEDVMFANALPECSIRS